MKTKRPVKMVLTREESLRVHVKRHPAKLYYKTGADKTGHVLALKARIVLDTGVYCSLGMDVWKTRSSLEQARIRSES